MSFFFVQNFLKIPVLICPISPISSISPIYPIYPISPISPMARNVTIVMERAAQT